VVDAGDSVVVVLFDVGFEHAVVAVNLQSGFVVATCFFELDLEFVGSGRFDINLIAGVGSVGGEGHCVIGAPHRRPTPGEIEGLLLVADGCGRC